MKKTIIALLALSGVAMATQTSETITFTQPSTVLAFKNSFDLSKDWQMTLNLSICPFYQGNRDVDIFSFTYEGGEFTLTSLNPGYKPGMGASMGGYSSEVYASPDLAPGSPGAVYTTWGLGAAAGYTYDVTMTYSEVTQKIALSVVASNGETLFGQQDCSIIANFVPGALLAGVSAPIPDDLDASSYWSLPTVTFTGTSTGSSASIPEPTTAALSLLALAGLAARRRRA